MREIRAWLFLGLGLLLAGLTGLSLYGVSQEMSGKAVAVAADITSVVIARADIPARTVISADMLTRKDFPRTLVPTGAVGKEGDAVGQTSIAPIAAGTPVVRSQFVAAGGKSGASLTLEKGKVLVAFPSADPLTVAGLVRPGDHIDILATLTSGTGEAARKTQTTVQNLEVVDVLTTGTGAQKLSSLTFVVDHQVALVLKYLRDAQATIDVVVRSQAESESTSTTSVDLTYLLQTYGVRK